MSTILVVDDHEPKRYARARMLKAAGYHVVEAATGQAALDSARNRPDLVVLDVHLPDISGFEVCRGLKAANDTAAVPVLHLSAVHVDEADKIEGLDAGADGYLVEPVSPDVLLATVRSLLRAGGAERPAEAAGSSLPGALPGAAPPDDLLASVSDGLLGLDADLRIRFANPAAARALQSPRDELAGYPIESLDSPLADADAAAHYRRAMRERVTVGFERALPESERWLDVRVYPRARGGVTVWFRESGAERRQIPASTEDAMLRDRILGIVGHDLRNPLNAILLSASALLSMTRIPEPAQRIVRRVGNAARRMADMIGALRDFAAIRQGGGLPIGRTRCDLSDVAREAIEELQVAHPGREVRLETRGDAVGLWDPSRLAQLVSNLVANALTHGDPASPVRITVDGRGEPVRLSVHNQGPPIPADLRPALFGAFQRGADGRPPAGHLGLGLYIARQIAAGHGGSVDVESGDRGTTFTVTLPRAMPPDPSMT